MTEPFVPQSQERSPLPAIIAWVIILACVATQMYRVTKMYREAAAKKLANPSAELQVSFSGKLAVGFSQMMATAAPSTTKPAATKPTTAPAMRPELQQYIGAMDTYSATPKDRVRTITVVAELQGPGAALDRIDKERQKNSDGEVESDLQTLRTIYDASPDSINEAQKKALIDRYGFFGKLAVSHGALADDPVRKEVLAEAQHATIVAIVIVVAFIGLGIVVLAAVITAIVLAAVGKIRLAYQAQPTVNSAFLEAFALSLVLMILAGLVLRLLHAESLSWEWILMVMIPAMMGWIRFRGVDRDEVWRGLGWVRGRGALIEIPCGLFGYFAGVPVIALGIFISLQLSKHAGTTPMHPIQQMLQGDKWHVMNLFFAASVIAPIVEETMFRGAFFNHLRRRWNWFISASVVALIFAAIHPQGWTFIPALGSIAIVLAAIREWRGSILGSIIAHATNNTIVLTLALLVAR
jgi:membrane protease YdiL (CAAX protease family)